MERKIIKALQKACEEAGLNQGQRSIILNAVGKVYEDKQAARIAKREEIITAALKAAGQIQ